MRLAEFLCWAMRYQHSMTDQAVQDLTSEQLHWFPPASAANHIGFTLWHAVRTEDHGVQTILQRKPTVWIKGAFYGRWRMEKIAQGTGMAAEGGARRAPACYRSVDGDQQQVWRATDAFLADADEETLERAHHHVAVGELPAREVLTLIMLHSPRTSVRSFCCASCRAWRAVLLFEAAN